MRGMIYKIRIMMQEIYNREVSKTNLCDYNDSSILVIGDTTVIAAPAIQLSFKSCAPFTKCIRNIDGTIIDVAEDLDLVMRTI